MNIEQVKEEAKKRFNKDITDEQAKAWLDAHPTGELQDEDLENVAGGGCSDDERGVGVSATSSCGAFSPRPEIKDAQQRRNCESCKYGYTDYSGLAALSPPTFCTRPGGPKE